MQRNEHRDKEMTAAGKKRILIVDDSVVVRKILSEVISQDPDLEVAGTAVNGHIGLTKFSALHPDLILLDVEMPEMDGLTTLAELRKIDSRVPIVMFSTLTEAGAATTLSALALGASDYCTKPSNTGSLAESTDTLKNELIPKIRALCKLGVSLPHQKKVVAPVSKPAVKLPRKLEIVAIGTSTGGPNALAEVIPKISPNFPVPIVIVQHMPPSFTRLLAQRLSAQSTILVREAVEGEKLGPGNVWLAPGGSHMLVAKTINGVTIRLTKTPPENFCRPAVDVLFRSVAQVYGAQALGVVLTGMGSDGLIGAKSIRQAGGEIILQDEESSVVWGMPGSIYASGVSDQVYPLSQMASQISRLANWGRALAAKT
jgi:two-component system, chemotaxis family, protein-glutamate methylesterase/glutaminase